MVQRAGIEVVGGIAKELHRPGHVGLCSLSGGEHDPQLPLGGDHVLGGGPGHPLERLGGVLGFLVPVEVDKTELVLGFRVAFLGGLPESFRSCHCIVDVNIHRV